MELSTGTHWAYAFTSQQKAKAFLRVMRDLPAFQNAKRLFPCTLKEWFDWQPQKKLPDLSIDTDPQALRDYPHFIQADLSKHNIQCLTTNSELGKTYSVLVQPQQTKQPPHRS